MKPTGLYVCSASILPAVASSDLFEEHKAWAEGIGRSVRRGLPPSFDIDDLEQEARIQHWRCVEAFDPGRGVPYRAFAYFPIRGAVLMSCRRRNYREATHEELNHGLSGSMVDRRPNAEAVLLRREERRNVSGPRVWRQRFKIRVALAVLPSADADLVRAVFFAGADVEALERATPGTRKQLSRAVYRLKRELMRPPQPQRMSDTPSRCEPAAQLPPEELRAAIAGLLDA